MKFLPTPLGGARVSPDKRPMNHNTRNGDYLSENLFALILALCAASTVGYRPGRYLFVVDTNVLTRLNSTQRWWIVIAYCNKQ